MAEATKINASEIEGLEDVLTEIVRKEFASRPREDIEELKHSPAGTMIRLEEQVQSLTEVTKAEFKRIDERFETIDERFETIDKRFETIDKRFEKIDEQLENMVTKEEFYAESKRVDKRFDKLEANQVQTDKNVQNLQEIVKTLVVKVDEQEKRLSFFRKVTYGFFSVLVPMMSAIVILLIKLLGQL